MATFAYKAISAQGREARGSVDAADPRAAAATLRDRGLYVMDLVAQSASPAANASAARPARRRRLARFRRITARDRVLLFSQLALMLRSGLTLVESLRVARRQAHKAGMARAIEYVIDHIQQGQTFSRAMRDQPRCFPPFTAKLVESAEASGELDVVLDRVADFLDRQATLRHNLLTSLTYPAIVVIVSLAVAAFLVLKVIPRFSSYLAQRQINLPWATQMLMDVSAAVREWGLWLGIGTAAVVAALVVTWMQPAGRLALDRLVLRVPLIGLLLTTGAMATFGQTLGMLLRSGVSLLESLQLTSRILGNRAIARQIDQAGERILAGRDLAGTLDDAILPPIVPQVVAVGEQTGTLSDVLEELGRYYNDRLQAMIRRMSSLIEPAMILILGTMVGFVYFAFFQAVFRLATSGR